MTSAERPRLPGQALRLLPFFLVAFVALSVWRLSQPAPGADNTPPGTRTFSGPIMGTTFNVKVVGPLTPKQSAEVEHAILSALTAVDDAMSTYKPSSELSRFNASTEADKPFPISEPLREVVRIALQVGKASGGALDVTVGPLVDAWGFGPEPRDSAPPSPEHIAELRGRVGLDKLELTPAGLIKKVPELRVDLSAVAKGYAVDQVAHALEALDQRDFLVEVGGELRAVGRREDGGPFRVGIEKPVSGQRALQRIVELRGQGMATSGDYRNYYEDHGKRRSHFLDPRTGAPVTHDLASVTVLASTTAEADAWATALSVLGPEEGPKVAEEHGLAAFFIVREGDDGFRSITSSRFPDTQSPVSP